jgi:hypothetical protein
MTPHDGGRNGPRARAAWPLAIAILPFTIVPFTIVAEALLIGRNSVHTKLPHVYCFAEFVTEQETMHT